MSTTEFELMPIAVGAQPPLDTGDSGAGPACVPTVIIGAPERHLGRRTSGVAGSYGMSA